MYSDGHADAAQRQHVGDTRINVVAAGQGEQLIAVGQEPVRRAQQPSDPLQIPPAAGVQHVEDMCASTVTGPSGQSADAGQFRSPTPALTSGRRAARHSGAAWSPP
jgi:hypothetical protein